MVVQTMNSTRVSLNFTLSFLDLLLRFVDGSDHDPLDDESFSASLLLLSDSESEVSAFPRLDFFFLDLVKRHETN